MVAARPSAKRMIIMALSSPVVRVAMDQRGAPGEDVRDREVLAEQEARVLRAVRGHVQQRAAAGQLRVPEVRRVRPGVALAGAHRREAADGAGLHHVPHPEQVRVEDHVLEVGVEDAGLVDRPEHVRGLGGVAAQGLRARDALARLRQRDHRVTVEVIRDGDDDEIDVVGCAQLLERGDRPAAEPLGVRVPALLARVAADGEDRLAHVAQAQGVELPDEAAAQHPDPHGVSSVASRLGRRRGRRRRPALRARKSRMIASVAVAPMRVTPRAITSSSASSVRTPPAALTWTCGEVLARIRRRSSWVAPDGAKPVLVLTKSPPAASVSRQARIFSSSVR